LICNRGLVPSRKYLLCGNIFPPEIFRKHLKNNGLDLESILGAIVRSGIFKA